MCQSKQFLLDVFHFVPNVSPTPHVFRLYLFLMIFQLNKFKGMGPTRGLKLNKNNDNTQVNKTTTHMRKP